MRITVRVKANARKNEVQKVNDEHYLVSVSIPPVDGKANLKVIELLSESLGVAKSKIRIIAGVSSKLKRIEVS